MSEGFEITDEYRHLFLEESAEQLEVWEESLLHLEQAPDNRELIDQVFRAIHTLKGSSGFVGFEKLQNLAHSLETSLADVRDGHAGLNQSLIEILFEGLDLSRKMIDRFSAGESSEEDIQGFLKKLNEHSGCADSFEQSSAESSNSSRQPSDSKERENEKRNEESSGDTAAQGPAKHTEENTSTRVFSVEIQVEAEKREAYLRALLLQHKLEELGKVITVSPSLEELKQKDEPFCYRVVVETSRNDEEVKQQLSIDMVNIIGIEEVEADSTSASGKNPSEQPLSATDSGTGQAGDGGLRRTGAEEAGQGTSARSGSVRSEEVVRVSVEKLDVMLNLVGELVVQNSGFAAVAGKLKESYGAGGLVSELKSQSEKLGGITRSLQDAVMKARMFPVGRVFSRFGRVVRDLSRERGKDVGLEVYGEETEIDKKVMDRIGEPLVHLVRNAVDHGIESVGERERAGKPVRGWIQLGAYQEGDHICIEVCDDGRGLERERIVERAVQRGLIGRGEAEGLRDEQVYGLIFRAGFSTAERVTDVSGRGVGMDVVRSTVEEMGGEVRVSSRAGEGTRVVITLPLTMAIIPAILVEVGGLSYALPVSAVREVVKQEAAEVQVMGSSRAIRLRDEVISVVELAEALGIDGVRLMGGGNGSGGRKLPVVIVGYGERKVGVVVEKLMGNQEIVIKSLSKHYREIEGLVGASILGSGKIALIVDVEAMVRSYAQGSGGDGNGVYGGEVSRRKAQGGGEDKGMEVINREMGVPGSSVTGRAGGDKHRPSGREGSNHEAPVSTESVINTREAEGGMSVVEKQGGGEELISASTAEAGAGTEGSGEGVGECGPEADGDKELVLGEEQLEKLEEIHNAGAISASASMSGLMGREVRVSFPSTRMVDIGEVGVELGGEERAVVGIYVSVGGEVCGGILLVLPMGHAAWFCDLLYGREPGSSGEVREEELSGLIEMGNILSASFINAMADTSGLVVQPGVPEASVDMCLSVVDGVVARFNRAGQEVLFTEAELYYGEQMGEAVCYLLMFMEPESMGRLSSRLGDDEEESREG